MSNNFRRAGAALFVTALTAASLVACSSEQAPQGGGDGGGESAAASDTIVLGFSQVGAESGWRAANTKSIQDTLTKENGFDLKFSDAQQ